MPFDPSVFAQAGRPTIAPVDPMAASEQTLGMANKLFAIRQSQANQAVGEAYQQAVGPDGSLDVNKLNGLISQDPRTAMAAQDAYKSSEALGTSQQARGLKYNDWLNATLPGLLQLPDDQLHDGVAAAMDRAVDSKLVPQSQASAVLTKLPDDAGKLRAALNSLQLAAMPAGAQRQQLYGAPVTVDNGLSIRGGVQQPAGPDGGGALVVPPQPGVDTFPSRAQQAGQVTGQDAKGNPTATPLGNRLIQQGRGDLLGPAGSAAANAAGVSAAPQPATGGPPRSLLPPGYTGRPSAGAGGGSQVPQGTAPAALAPGSGGAPDAGTTAPVGAGGTGGVGAGTAGGDGSVVVGMSPQRKAALETQGTSPRPRSSRSRMRARRRRPGAPRSTICSQTPGLSRRVRWPTASPSCARSAGGSGSPWTRMPPAPPRASTSWPRTWPASRVPAATPGSGWRRPAARIPTSARRAWT